MTADVRSQAADLIDAAIGVLHERGWCQGELRDVFGRVCIEGALHQASGEVRCTRTVHAREAIRDAAGERPHRFNDRPGMSVEDVVLTMKQAAASLREPQP